VVEMMLATRRTLWRITAVHATMHGMPTRVSEVQWVLPDPIAMALMITFVLFLHIGLSPWIPTGSYCISLQ
jgi:hypothetical protein